MTHELSLEIKKYKNERFNNYLQRLNNEKTSGYSLRKSTENLNRPTTQSPSIHMADGNWARTNSQKADYFLAILLVISLLILIHQQGISRLDDQDDYTIPEVTPVEVFEQI